jgi:hypothetical protein
MSVSNDNKRPVDIVCSNTMYGVILPFTRRGA